MTTAWPLNDTENSPGEFAHGSEHINPIKAINPGLVHEASKDDYIKLLCSILDEARVKLISGNNITCPTGSEKGLSKDLNYPCPTGSEKGLSKDLNYPSLAGIVSPGASFSIKINRTVRNLALQTLLTRPKASKIRKLTSKWCLKFFLSSH
ncbi:hypothetical protein ACFX15_039230 [Malus domestica]